MTRKEFIYSTTDTDALAAFHTAEEAFRAAGNRIVEDAQKLGNNRGVLQNAFGGLPTFVGLIPDDPDNPPEGWRYLRTRERLEPIARGKAGAEARQWLAERQMPPEADVHDVLAKHGLQKAKPYWTDDGMFSFGRPGLLEHEGTLWARYGVEAPDCTWERRKLSDFYAAWEAAVDAENQTAEAEKAGAR